MARGPRDFQGTEAGDGGIPPRGTAFCGDTMLLAPLALCVLPGSLTGSTNGWGQLDAELDGLQSAMRVKDMSPLHWSGFVRTSYGWSQEPAIDTNDADLDPDERLSGFFVDNARLAVGGTNETYTYYIGTDLASGKAELIDAWIGIRAWGQATVYAGRMRAPFLRTSLLPENTNLFIPRTRNAILWTVPGRDYGFRIDNDWDGLRLKLCQQNGFDGEGEKLRSTGRFEWDVLGQALPNNEGAYGAGDAAALGVGVAFSHDAGLEDDDRTALAGDLALVWNSFSLQFEIMNYGEGWDDPFDPDTGSGFELRGNSTPWSLTASYLFLDSWEFAARYEDFDEEEGATFTTSVAGDVIDRPSRTQWYLGVNKYISGHDLKWQLNYFSIEDANAGGQDNNFVALGATLAF